MAELPMPRLGDSMEEGIVVRWLKAEGEQVEIGEELVEIETDKATMVYEADLAGTLEILVADGESAAVGAPIARLSDGVDEPATQGRAKGAQASDGAGSVAPSSVPDADRPNASPLARRAAEALGVDLTQIAGTGPRGRILKADVVAAADGAEVAQATEPSVAYGNAVAEASPASSARGASRTVAPTRAQRTIARRMAESKATAPDFTVGVDVDMGALVDLREQMKRATERAPSVNDMVVRAAALCLREHPKVNAAYRDGSFALYERINIGVAVAATDSLLVPVLVDADKLTLSEIAERARGLAERARTGELTPPEMAGGTFTVSNLGMFGADRFTGVINPPQAAILCVGAITNRPAVGADGALEARPLASLSLVCDHRIVYGADAASMLASVREMLEHPLRLVL
jgi:pyruvate dehydrogenase E2 component (dihydrolipoamide acetyltransferase)